MNDLELLKQTVKEYRDAWKAFVIANQKWYTWNYWAQRRQNASWFSIWMAKNNLDFQDVKASRNQHVPIRKTQAAGIKYFNDKEEAKAKFLELGRKRDAIGHRLWLDIKKKNDGDKYGMKDFNHDLEDIARAFGRPTDETYKWLKVVDGFVSRREYLKELNSVK